jgi:fructosamine-3-kinase
MNVDALAPLLSERLGSAVQHCEPVAGGDINDAFRVRLSAGGAVFLKTRGQAIAGMYAREAEGLAYLNEAAALRIPKVLAVDERFLVLEWIGRGPRGARFEEELGRGLAQLHKHGARRFGLAHDNWVGSLPQCNAESDSWAAFYGQRRLSALSERARRAGAMNGSLHARLEKLCARLSALCGAQEPPSRLHGDLWSGNVMCDERGAPVLIDPAVYGGDREVDLAMLQLFGSPSARFFAAYDEVYARKAGADERVALYQLYPLLVHVCLFGAGYLGQLERALRYYD